MEDLQKDNEVISLKKIIIDYIGQWRLFVACGIISVLLSIVYLAFYPKTYETIARIKIQEEKDLTGGGSLSLGDASGLMRSFGLDGGGSGAVNLDDEWAVFSSNQLLRKVVYRLGLDVTYKKPFSIESIYTENPIQVIPDSSFRANINEEVSLILNVEAPNKITVKVKRTGEKYSFSSFPFKLDLQEGSLAFVEKQLLDSKYKVNISVSPARWVAENLSEAIEVDDFSKTSNTLEFLYQDYDMKRGIDILDCMIDEFNAWTSDLKQDDNDKSMAFLDERIWGILDELGKVELSIEQYKIKNKMTDVEYDLQFYSDAIKLLREKIVDMEVQNHLIGLLDSYVKDPNNKYSVIPSLSSSSSEGDKQGSVTSYNEALIAYEKMKSTATKDNPLSEVTEKQLDIMREGAIVSIENAHKSISLTLDNLKKQESDIFAKMDNVPTYEREYLELKRQQEILQGVYLILLQKREEVALANGKQTDRGLVVDEAYAKFKTVAPRKIYAGLFVIIFTLIVPVICLFVRERLVELKDAYKEYK